MNWDLIYHQCGWWADADADGDDAGDDAEDGSGGADDEQVDGFYSDSRLAGVEADSGRQYVGAGDDYEGDDGRGDGFGGDEPPSSLRLPNLDPRWVPLLSG